MKKIVLAAVAIVSLATVAQATTTIQTIGGYTYINSYGTSGYSSVVCYTVGTITYCN